MAKTIKEEDLRLNILINGGDAARKQILDTENAVSELTSKYNKQKAELEDLISKGDEGSKRYKSLSMHIGRTKKELDESTAKLASLKRQLSINAMTLDELRKHAAQTRIALSNAVPGSKNWEILRTELVNTKNRMKELDNQSKTTRNTLCEAFTKASKYIQTFVGGIYAAVKASQTVRKATDAYAEYDEALTDAMKTTNLSKEEVTDLSERLK